MEFTGAGGLLESGFSGLWRNYRIVFLLGGNDGDWDTGMTRRPARPLWIDPGVMRWDRLLVSDHADSSTLARISIFRNNSLVGLL